jgi:hypothetical protein
MDAAELFSCHTCKIHPGKQVKTIRNIGPYFTCIVKQFHIIVYHGKLVAYKSRESLTLLTKKCISSIMAYDTLKLKETSRVKFPFYPGIEIHAPVGIKYVQTRNDKLVFKCHFL